MRIAFAGKGGSGKTTLTALFSKYLVNKGLPVLAIDADINEHLPEALGMSAYERRALPVLGHEKDRLKEYFRGTNKRVASNKVMLKTTPPGNGSQFVSFADNKNEILEHFEREVNGVRVMLTGGFQDSDLGVHCFNSKLSGLEMLFNHMVDGEQEYVLADMRGGVEVFSTGLFSKFDVIFLVVEPTVRSASLFCQFKKYACDHGIALHVVGNKIESEGDVEFIRNMVGGHLIGWVTRSSYIKNFEKGMVQPIGDFEIDNSQVFDRMLGVVDGTTRDVQRMYDQTVHFHKRNCTDWGNTAHGADLTKQIDPDFNPLKDMKA